jgi:hypothetical protein
MTSKRWIGLERIAASVAKNSGRLCRAIEEAMGVANRIFGLIFLVAFISPSSMAAGFNADYYHLHYGMNDPYQKRVDDHGNGYEALYGVRNFREVLTGVLFRGGANNSYNRDGVRNNKNPLPQNGLADLCAAGFQTAIYLYPTNYSKAAPQTFCDSLRGKNTLHYLQLSYASKSRQILEMIRAAVFNSTLGPIYVHCWNGRHASGFISALALRQFCEVSGDDAVSYWIKNTDGDSNYPDHKKAIQNFVPHKDLMIDAQTKQRICPQL